MLGCLLGCLFVNGLGLESLEAGNRNVGNEGVHLVLGIFVFIATAAHANTDAMRDSSDTLGPNGLVELGIDADVFGAHSLHGELLDGLDGRRSALLEGLSMDVLVQVNSVFTSDDFGRVSHVCMRSGRRVKKDNQGCTKTISKWHTKLGKGEIIPEFHALLMDDWGRAGLGLA